MPTRSAGPEHPAIPVLKPSDASIWRRRNRSNARTRCGFAALLILMCPPAWAQNAAEAFYRAIRQDNLADLERLIKTHGAKTRDSRGNTPLMYAAAVGSLPAVQRLVEAGVPVNAANDFGATPLMWGAGELAKVRYLLEKGANANAKSKIGRTPLFIAAAYDGSVETARLLIAKGADVNAKEASGATVLATAAYSNNLDFVRLLLEKGANPNTTDLGGFTPLAIAAFNGGSNSTLLKLLLDRGLPVNARCVDSLEMVKNGPIGLGRLTALMFTASQANHASTELLIQAGAAVNAADIRGMTLLMLSIATDRADPAIVRLLLAKGADPKIKSKAGENAFDWARKYQNPEILRALGLAPAALVETPLPPPSATSIPTAVERSVALLQSTSAAFLGKGGCPACHAQHHTGMAVVAARAAGVKVNWALEQSEALADASLRGSLEQSLFQLVDPPPGTDGHSSRCCK